MIGKTISHYKILEKLGQGGMGVVYKAEDTKLKRTVALKFLPSHLTRNETDKARFLQEAQAAAALNHPNVCTTHEIHDEGENPFIVMEYLEGKTLREIVHENPPESEMPGIREIVDHAIQIAGALKAAHGKGIVHRDVKSENIMVTKTGQVKVMDFGLAKLRGSVKLTKTSSTVGTVAYMSPEHIEGKEVDARTDIFSFGVVLYEMLTGYLPFKGEYDSAMMYAIVNEEPEPIQQYRSDVSSELLHVLNRTLEKKPDERYQSVNDMLIDLKRLKRDTNKVSRESLKEMPVATSRKKSRISPIVLWLIAGAIGLTIILFMLFKFVERGSKKQPFEQMQITRLTSHGKAKDAAISPDGKYIVHVMEEAGKESLWLRQVATNSNVQILPPADVQLSGLTISQDGNYIYYLIQEKNRMTNTLYRLPILGGTPAKVLENVYSPITFSPNGGQFTFLRFDRFPTDDMVMLANSDGSDVKVLAKRKFPDIFSPNSTPAWSPDGKVIVCGDFLARDKIFLLVKIDINDGSERHFCTQKWDVIRGIAWLSDGSGFLMVAKYQTSNYQIWYVSYPEGEPKRITNDLNNYSGVCLTADDSSLLTVQSEQSSSIWVVSSGKVDQAKQITSGRYDGAHGIAWTPDGKILHATWDYKLWLIDSDGGNSQRLTPDEREDLSPAVSPDGQTIFFTTIRGSTFELWKMEINGTKPVQLAPLSAYPQCTPDGNWVVYGSFAKGKVTIMKMSTKSGETFLLIDKYAFGPAISPDGNKIACYLGDETEQDKMKIAVFPFEGGEPEKIFDLPKDIIPDSFLRWTPGRKAITFSVNQGGVSNIWSQPLDGSPPKQLTHFKENLIFAFDWSQNGTLACSCGEVDNDVVLIKDVK